MYGESAINHIKEIRKNKKIAIIIGADKVPASIYQIADYNIGITNQPHSEVAALGVFLHECMQGKEDTQPFTNSKLQIVPSPRGKQVKRQ